EESVFTILSYRHPERFRCYMVEENGLLGTFFQALRDGDVKRLLLRPSKTDEREPQTRPAGIAAADPEGVEKGTTTFLGLRMMQNSNVGVALQELTRYLAADGDRVTRIILIGTDLGGLAVLLQVYCLSQNADFIAYDSAGSAAESPAFKRLQIDLRVHDLAHEFVIAEIAREIQKPGRTVLLCDGPDKPGEVNAFGDFLKTDDIIMAHDYAPSREEFDRRLRGSLWSWCEITDQQIEAAIERNQLEPL